MRNVKARPTLAVLAILATGTVRAGVFSIDTDVSGVRTSTTYSSVESVFDALTGARLASINPAYSGSEAARGAIDYRGVAVLVSYPTANAPQLVLQIPSIGLVKTFDGATRDESQKLLKDYFKQNGDGILGRLSEGLAKESPVDPVAGNPNSLMSRVVMSDFNGAIDDAFGGQGSGDGGHPGIGVEYSQYRQSAIDSRAFTLPLSYTFRGFDQGRQLTIRLPVTYSDAEGSKSYSVGLGGAYRIPINDAWALTAAANYVLAGSRDLGALAGIASFSLGSTYLVRFPSNGLQLVIGNMVGYYDAVKVKSGNYGYDPGISNTVLRNGVFLSQPTSMGGYGLNVTYSLVDTHFFGTDLYTQHYDEVGFAIGNRALGDARTSLRAGVNYLFSPKSKGINFRLNYWF